MSNYPRVDRDDASAGFFDAAGRGQLLIKRSRLGLALPPQASADPDRASDPLEVLLATGQGTVVSWAVVQQAPHPLLVEAVPYVSAVIELDEGPWLIVRLVGDRTRLAVGARVCARYETTGVGDDCGEVAPVFEIGDH
jgi:uncharacterized OB-fold protein